MNWAWLNHIKLAAISLIVFVAWLGASNGLVRLVAVVWLVYPTIVAWRIVKGRREA
jgi:hypothetical protein